MPPRYDSSPISAGYLSISSRTRVGRGRKTGMRPDDPHLRIVAEQEEQRFLVAMHVEPQILFDREIDNALDLLASSRLAVDVALADAAIIAALVFGLDQVPDRRIVEPGLDVATHAIRPDERHDREPGRLRVDELVRALVRPAGRDDAGDVVAAENLQHLVELVERVRFLIVVQMRVEDFQRRLRQRSRRSSAPKIAAPAARNIKPGNVIVLPLIAPAR